MNSAATVKQALERFESLTAGLPLDEALAKMDEAINDPANSVFKPHFEVQKAEALWATGRAREAVALLERCAAEHDDIDSVSYFAGEHLLELGEFARAMPHLSRCIHIAEATANPWYEDSALLLRAYCAAHLGLHEQARQDLARVPDDDGLPWLNADPVVSKSAIERLLWVRDA